MDRKVDQVYKIVGDERRNTVCAFKKWLDNVSALRARFTESYFEFDPFEWNETASVALLGNAATIGAF